MTEIKGDLARLVWDLARLRRISAALHSLDEGDCNGRSERGQKAADTRTNNLMREAGELAARYGLFAYHQGDCRGCALYLVTSEQNNGAKYNEGVAIARR